MKTIEMFMRSPEQVEKCRSLLLKAIDDTLRPNSRTVSLMDLIEQRMPIGHSLIKQAAN